MKEITYAKRQSCQYRASFGFQENGINPYIWCVVGALLGGIAGLLSKNGERAILIESLGVGIFGAYIGGDFVTNMLTKGPAVTTFTMMGLGLALAGSLVSLLLLRLMRGAVGPQHKTKGPRRRD